MYKYTYAQKNCVGSVVNVLAVPLGVCLQNYQVSGNSVYNSGFQMYSCNNGTDNCERVFKLNYITTYISYLYLLLATTGVPSVSYFHNARCTFADGNFNTTISFTSDCSYVTDTEYYDIMDSQSYSASLQCTSAASYQSIIPESSAAYAVNT